ncbi:MAG: CBS domain-containing protein, partial [archaeon]|nr:CBS domain-containing protein [archaeon]
MVSTLGELNLRDEYAILEYNAVLADAAKALSPVQHSAVLVRGKKGKGIVGILKMQVLLHHLAEGTDPVSTPVTSIMQTEILRLRSNTPMDKAIEIIQERNPHAVIVINDQDTFEGYISAADFREMKSKMLIASQHENVAPETIGEAVDLRDEFRIVSVDDTLDSAALLLRRPSVQFVLAQGPKKGIEGVLSVQHVLRIIAGGKLGRKEKIKKHMKTNLLRLRENTPLDIALDTIREREPDGVIVLDQENMFVGFLSPSDFRELSGHIVEEIEHDGTFNSLGPHLIRRYTNGQECTVVWTHLGSEIIIYTNELTVEQDGEVIFIEFPVETDQSGRQVVTIEFNLGSESNSNRSATVQRNLETHEIIQEVWGKL